MAWHQLTEWASPWRDDPDLRVCFGRDDDGRVMAVQHRQGSEIYSHQILTAILVADAPLSGPPVSEAPPQVEDDTPPPEAIPEESPPPAPILVAEPAADETPPPVVEKAARNVWMLSIPPPDANPDESPPPEAVRYESPRPVVPDETPPPGETPRQTPPPDIWADAPAEGEEVKAPQFRERTVVRPFPRATPIGAVDDAGPVTMFYAQSPLPQKPTKHRHGRVTRWFYAQLPFAPKQPKRRRKRVARWSIRIVGLFILLVLFYLIWAGIGRAGLI